MTSAHAWLDGDVATPDEIADRDDLVTWSANNPFKFGADTEPTPKRRTMAGTLQPWGEHKGDLYVNGPSVNSTGLGFGEAAIEALRLLLAQDERVRAGHYYIIEIIA